jgi:hypothetical protein
VPLISLARLQSDAAANVRVDAATNVPVDAATNEDARRGRLA